MPLATILASVVVSSCLAWFLRVHSYDLDAIGLEIDSVIELEIDIFDNEGPDFVAEAVGIEMTLWRKRVSKIRLHRLEEECAVSTLKLRRALTFSARTSDTMRSKC